MSGPVEWSASVENNRRGAVESSATGEGRSARPVTCDNISMQEGSYL
jgi:hypothetical protein